MSLGGGFSVTALQGIGKKVGGGGGWDFGGFAAPRKSF